MDDNKCLPKDCTPELLFLDILPEGYTLSIKHNDGIFIVWADTIYGEGSTIKDALISFHTKLLGCNKLTKFGFWTDNINWLKEKKKCTEQ